MNSYLQPSTKPSIQLTQADIDKFLEGIREKTNQKKITEDQFRQFTKTVRTVLENYQKELPEDTEIQYHTRYWLGKLHIAFFIPGPSINPFEEGSSSFELNFLKKINALVYRPLSDVNYFYSGGINIVTITLQNNVVDLHVLKNKMFLAAVLGLILGLLCHQLPANVSSFLVDELVSPVLHIIINMASGIMGPVIFLSLLTSITTLNSINELNNQGIRLFRRFVGIALFIIVVSILVALPLFPILGQDKVSFDSRQLLNLFFGILPTNLFSPFVDNNIPQIVILGLLMGAALLIISKKTPVLPSLLVEVRDWFNQIMDLVLRLMPAVPFFSIFKIAAEGRLDMLIKGWKYIVGTYLCMLICFAVKLFKVSVRCKIKVTSLLKKIGPLSAQVFSAGDEVAGIGKFLEISKNDFGIDPDFTSFWNPLNQALMAPASPIGFVLAAFMVADLTGTAISPGFLLVLIVMSLQLTLASPGFVPGMTILFQSTGLSTNYIGLFSAYSVFIKNSAAAYSAAYRTLEELEIAYRMGHVDKACLQQANS